MSLLNSPDPKNPTLSISSEEEILTRDHFVPFCIARRDCQKQFCLCDLLDTDMRIINPNKCFTTLMICDTCYREIHKEYKIFSSKVNVKEIRYHFMDSYIAVKIYLMLNKIKSEIESNRCDCGKVDCVFNRLGAEERKIINEKFNLMYDIFATPSVK